MKNTLAFSLLVAGLVFGYQRLTASDESDRYDLATVETRPVPKAELFRLWQAVALERCGDAVKNHNLTPEQCRNKVAERNASCARQAGADAPYIVGSPALSRRLGQAYLECAMPYYFCNGVEVRSEAEARQHCAAEGP